MAVLYFQDITDKLTSDYSDQLTWYRIISGFNLPIGYYDVPYNSWDPMDNFTLELVHGDVIGVASMKYQDTYRHIKRINICLYKNKLHPFGLSVDFFKSNTHIFSDITLEINRDKKINKILK